MLSTMIVLFFAIICKLFNAFQLPSNQFQRIRLQTTLQAFSWSSFPLADIDLDTLQRNILENKVVEQTVTSTSTSSFAVNPVDLLLLSSAVLYVVYNGRPRGSLNTELVSVRNSLVVNGLGLFAATNIPEGTILGSYPGYIRSLTSLKDISKKISND